MRRKEHRLAFSDLANEQNIGLRVSAVLRYILPPIVLAAVLAAPKAAGQTYRVDSVTPPEGITTKALAVNRYGDAVGWTTTDAPTTHGAYWFQGQMLDLHETIHFGLGQFLACARQFNADYSQLFDISDSDHIVGAARKSYNCPQGSVVASTAFVMRAATLSDFGTPIPPDALTDLGTFGDPCLALNSSALAVKNYYIVGWSELTTNGPVHAFLVRPVGGLYYVQGGNCNNSLLIDLGTLAAADTVSVATDVNDAGQIVGYSYTPSAAYHAFLLTPLDTNSDGVPDTWFRDINADGANDLMVDLGTLGGTNSWARGVNNLGQVVGEADTGDLHTRAFLWQNGAMTSLGTLGGDNSSAARINNYGQVVGWAEDSKATRRAFLWKSGTMTDLNDLIIGATAIRLTEARDINDVDAAPGSTTSRIVGWGQSKSTSDVTTIQSFVMSASTDSPDPDNGTQNGNANSNANANSNTSGTDNSNTSVAGNTTSSLPPLIPPVDTSSSNDNSASTTTDTGATNSTPTLCGAGMFGFAPLAMLGVLGLRVAVRRRK